MRTIEDDKITYYKLGIADLITKTEPLGKRYPYYKVLLHELKTKSKELTFAYGKQYGNVSQPATEKNAKLNATIKQIICIANAVNMHTLEKGLTKTQKRLPNNFTDYSRPSHPVRLIMFNSVLTEAGKVKNIARYGVTAKKLRDAQQLLTEYNKIAHAPAIAKTTKSNYSAQCRKLTSEIYSFIQNQLKPFFENIKDENLEEYISFKTFLNRKKTGRPASPKIERRRIPKINAGKLLVTEH